ncbi:MAG: hypothetical protein NC099_00680 [Corallococcus sp.]|nr:hypothetical protein [Bacillota bacterium]MCM1533149.1 hypothetical protein [Corallococcus sp.]
MEKNKLLKVSSILMIVCGAFLALMALIFFAAGDLVSGIIGGAIEDSGADAATIEAAVRLMIIILGVVYLIDAAAYIAAGVIGVMQKSSKACFITAIVVIVVCGIGAIMDIIYGQWFSALLGLVIPVLYLVGAIQLRNAAKANEEVPSASAQE